MLLDHLSNQERAILLATRVSENAQTVEELARNTETYRESAQKTLSSLVAKEILEPIEQWDGSIVYGFPDNEYAQSVSDEIYGPLP